MRVVLELRHAVGGGEKEEEDVVMEKRFTFRTVRMVVAAAMLLLSPLFAHGQGDKEIHFNFKLLLDGSNTELTKDRYGYEFRVRVGKKGTVPRYVGAYRAWATENEYPGAAMVQRKTMSFYPALSKIECSADDEVFIDWYDHVMTMVKNVALVGTNWDIYYPKEGRVTIKNKNGDNYANDSNKLFFGPVEAGALDAEVRIPWQYVQDVDTEIYTVLNKALGNNANCSFTLPSDLEDGSTVEVTLKMAKKEWKTLKFVTSKEGETFDGSMRVRMKSPGDKHFMMNYLNAGYGVGGLEIKSIPFYEAYPYPNTDHPGAEPFILEGTLMVVEARSWAADGVCVDNKYPARSVTLANPGDLNKINAASEGDDGQAYSGNYWLVPLWSEGNTVEVRPGPCPGGNVTINCQNGSISLYKDRVGGEAVPDGSVVKSNRRLYGKFSPYKVESCSKPPVVQWGVMPDRIQSTSIDAAKGEFSFVPGGKEGETIGVWIYNEPIMTKLHYDDETYLVEYSGDVKNDGESVPCGSEVMVKVKDQSKVDGCVGKIRVDVGGTTQFIEQQDGVWKPVQVTVEGEQAEFTFTQENKKYAIHWTEGPGYSIKVEAGESAAQLKGIQVNGEAPCGGAVKITVTPGNGLKVQGLKAVYDDGTFKEAAPVGSNTLEIAPLSQGIQEIEVKVGTDPQVTVDETFSGERVVKITVRNASHGVNIWADGKYQVTDGVFANGDELEVSLEPMGGCVDGDKVEVEVTWNNNQAIEQKHSLTKADNTLNIPKAYNKVTVKVLHSEPKQFAVSWSGTNFKVQQDGRDLTLGGSVACGRSIAIVPNPPTCEQVKEVKVNGVTVSPSQDGKYLHEVKDDVNSIEVAFEPKKINVEWAGVTNVGVEVNGATSPMQSEVNCGKELTVVFMPKAGDGAVQEVAIAEEGKGEVTLTPGSHAGYTWEDNAAGQTTVKWSPEGNVTIESVVLPEKYTVTYTNDPDSKYTVEVVGQGGAVPPGSQVLGGAKLTVKVTVATPAEWKVVKVNGDGNVTVTPGTNNKEYTYTFTLTKDTEVKVELGKQMYKVSYVQSADVKEMKVCEGRQNGSEIVSGSEVEYGSAIYVYVAVEKKQGSAVQGVESVTVKYKGSGGEVGLGVVGSPKDGWYKLEKLEGEIVGIDVKVEKLEPGEVLIVYSEKAQGGEDEQPYGVKGFVTWKDKDGQRIVPGQKKKVKVSDRITWSLAAAMGVEDSKLLAVCLAANRGYAQRLEETDREKAYGSLGELLDLVEGLKDKAMAQEVTEVRLETYVTVKLEPKPLLVLTVRKPQLGGKLEVVMPGAGGASLDYDKSYRVSGETEVTLKAEAQSPVVLKEVRVGIEKLALTQGQESKYKLPPYDPASANGNRLAIYANFAQEDADNCLLTLQANPPEGGAVTALRKSNREELPSGQQYQRELDVEVRVQAKEGYYIKSVIQNGSELYGNVQSDTTKVMYSFSIKLSAKELLVQADFSPIPRGGKEGKTNAVESAALRGVEIYPNPTDGAIEVRGASGVARYAVYDVTGREMLGGVHDGGAQLRIDLGMLASGFYIVQLRSADGGMRAEGVLRR